MHPQKWARIERIKHLIQFASQLQLFEFRGSLGCNCEDCRCEEAVCYYDDSERKPVVHDDPRLDGTALCSACAVRAWINRMLGG